jgi:hypothetical protein
MRRTPCHSIENRKQLAHAGSNCQLLWFTGLKQFRIEGSDDRVMASRHQGAHIQAGSDLLAATPDLALTAKEPAIAIEGRYADQSSDLLAIETAELRQLGQECGCQHRADARSTTEQRFALLARRRSS